MVVMCLSWALAKNTFVVPIPALGNASQDPPNDTTPLIPYDTGARNPDHKWTFDIVDIRTINLYNDEYSDEPSDGVEDEIRGKRFPLFWRLYYMLA